VQKGDEIEVQEQGSKVIISTESPLAMGTKTMDITGMDRTTILLSIRSAYRQGYDTIELKYSKPVAKHLRTGEKKMISSIIYEEISRLVGVEIIQQRENSCLVKSISTVSFKDFNSILRRIFILLKDAFEDLLEGIKRGDRDLLGTIQERHDNITKFISYSIRLLNKKGYDDITDLTSFYHIVIRLEEITDVLKWTARDVLAMKKLKFSDKSLKLLADSCEGFKLYYDFFYKLDPMKVTKFYEIRNNTMRTLKDDRSKLSAAELMIVQNNIYILTILVAITETRIGIKSL
jgi:phosphate uptake regulator